ncbi:MAG: hypothetical protein Q9N62_00795 [Ghiorsea sp.]|nr:hypothetical protein [Ghiorsea sp.]
MKGKSLDLVQGNEAERLFLRNWFINPEDEVKIAKLIWNYFKAVKNRWETAWGNPNYILTKSTGIIAFMRFLKDIVAHEGYNKIISVEEFQKALQDSSLQDEDFKNEQFTAGGVGQSSLYKKIKGEYKSE